MIQAFGDAASSRSRRKGCVTSLTMLCTDGSELATQALAAGLGVLAPAERTLVVTVVEPVDASLLLGASGLAGGVINEEQYAEPSMLTATRRGDPRMRRSRRSGSTETVRRVDRRRG